MGLSSHRRSRRGLSCLAIWSVAVAALAGDCPPEVSLAWQSEELVHEYMFSVSSFQQRLESYYLRGARPPLMQAFFLLRLPRDQQEAFMDTGCVAAFALAQLLVAEFRLGTRPAEASGAYEAAMAAYARLPNDEQLSLSAEWSAWPVAPALEQIRRSENLLKPRQRPTLDFVVAHCRESLDWLNSDEFTVPIGASLVVYEKCGVTSDLARAGMRFSGGARAVPRPDMGGTRGDECSAYLTHMTQLYDRLADFTVFLQSDPNEHLHFGFLDAVLQSVDAGVYNTPFLHLNGPRHVRTLTPCLQGVHEEIFGTNLTEILGPYCCAQFIVSRNTIRLHNRRFYERMLRMVDGTPGVEDICGIKGAKRSSHCYGFEFLWHMVFGQEAEPPLREDDRSLPLFLRLKHGNEHIRTDWRLMPLARDSPIIHNPGPLS